MNLNNIEINKAEYIENYKLRLEFNDHSKKK